MKQELEKSFDNMTVKIQTVKSTLNETKTDAAKVRDHHGNRCNNSVLYRLQESNAQSAENKKKQ